MQVASRDDYHYQECSDKKNLWHNCHHDENEKSWYVLDCDLV